MVVVFRSRLYTLVGGYIQIEITKIDCVAVFRLQLPRLVVWSYLYWDFQEWWGGYVKIEIIKIHEMINAFRLRLPRLLGPLYLDWDSYIDIFITLFIIIIKSEVSNFPILVIFAVVVCLRWVYYHILLSIIFYLSLSLYIYIYIYISRERRDLLSIVDVQSMVLANERIYYGLWVVFVCLQITPSHYHHYADLSEGIEVLKYLSSICCRVCV